MLPASLLNQAGPGTTTTASCQGLPHRARLGSDSDLDLDTGLDVDNDLLDDLGGGVEATKED